jgi:radical SAM superfamily enzyme YgiQ (UPF0313 family)
MFAESPDTLGPVLADFRPDVLVIYDDGFNYLTKMCLTNMREAAFKMSEMARAAGCKVIASSSDSTDHFEKYLDHCADYVIIGEAEQTLLELAESIRKNSNDWFAIPGIATRIDGETVKTTSRQVMTDLDEMPLPAWDLIDIEQYRAAWLKSSGYFSINIGTTRGCPFKCNWCAKPIYGNRYNARSPENVVKELMVLKENYGFDHVWFCDDIFGLKPGWVTKFAELVEAQNLRFRFKIQSRADLLLKDEQIEPLARAGCDVVWMGAESGSQKILDAMDKGTTIEQIAKATAMLKQYGIRPAFFLQFGYLGETAEDIRKTLAMVKKLVPSEIGVSVSYPLPGTRFYEKVREQLGDKTNWTDSDELALMFENTYPREFYKRLHRYVHSFYRNVRAIDNLKNGIVSRNFTRRLLMTLLKLPFYSISAARYRMKLKELR